MPAPKRSTGPLLLEYNGPSEGWFIIAEAGQVINPPIMVVSSLAYYLRQHQLAERVTNLNDLGSRQLVEIAKTYLRE